MRLIGTFKDQKLARDLSAFLERNGIPNQLDVETNKDWGSSNYGDTTSNLWVIEEDQMDTALAKVEEFLSNPQAAMEKAPPLPKIWLQEPLREKIKEVPKVIREQKLQAAQFGGLGTITTAILIICTLLLLISSITMPQINNIPEKLPYNVLLTPTINKELMYDYPYAYSIMDKIISAYGIESFENPNEMTPQEQALINTFNNTPYWKGFYDKLINFFTKGEPLWNFNAPMFEKIQEGQIWRLLTPIFLHYDIFHLFFNMIWLIVLGKQMEQRLGAVRYILFIVLTGIVSNTIQYLMTGPNFIGFSGVLCAMITFVWVRQKKAAWEGYQLQSSTFTFIMAFIIAMFGIQLISFFMEIFTKTSFAPGIANAAHLSGALMGVILGRLDFFAYKNR